MRREPRNLSSTLSSRIFMKEGEIQACNNQKKGDVILIVNSMPNETVTGKPQTCLIWG